MQLKDAEASVKKHGQTAGTTNIRKAGDAASAKAELEKRRWIVLVSVAIILFVIALFALFLAKPANTLSSCSSRALPNLKYSCYEYFANQTKNATICNNIPVPTRYSCISNVALLSSNPNLCTYTGMPSSYRNYCLDTLGVSTRNSSVCAEMNGTNESACAYGVAQALNFSSADACSYINNNTLMSTCYSKYYYEKAASTGESAYCNYLPSTPNETIMVDILSTASNFSRISDAYTYTYYNITPKGACYSNVAALTKNQSLCSDLSGITSQLCMESFITPKPLNESNLLSSCSSVPSDLYSVCVEGVLLDEAVKTDNVSICLSMNQSSFKNSCISEIAAKTSNSTYCSYINNATLQGICASYINVSK